MPPRRPPALAIVAIIGLLAAGCASETTPTAGLASAAPVAAAPPCTAAPEPEPGAQVPEGVVLPPGWVLEDVAQDGPAVQVTGYVGSTPVEVREFYQAQDDIRIELIEDEVVEAEILYVHAGRRVYVKAQAVCDRGSQLLVVSAPASAGGSVPTPRGSG